MRQFKLINALGQEWDLMRQDAFLYDINGLGFGIDTKYSSLGNRFVAEEEREKQPNIAAKISLKGYLQHDDFRRFCRVGGLVLCYKPLDTWYHIDVDVDISHADISRKTRRLECDVNFLAKSYWYDKITAYKSEEDKTIGKRYPYRYNYTYSSGRIGVIDVIGGDMPSSCKIHIFGPCINPSFTVSSNGKKVADGRINCTLTENRKIVINSDPLEMEIAEYDINNQYIIDRYQDSDFNTDRIVDVPKGESRFIFTQSNGDFLNAYIEVKKLV